MKLNTLPAQHKINRTNLTTQGAQEMKTALFALALLLTGCLTEPKVETRVYGLDCVNVVEADSTVTRICTMVRK